MRAFTNYIKQPVSIAPLVSIRIIFGLIMSFSMLRFIVNGWVNDLYVKPSLYFPFYGFEWVKPLPEWLIYFIFISLVISFLMISVGLFYKASTAYSFLAFSYIELIDKTNYLNHYYFVSLFCLLLLLLPAHRSFSLDNLRNPNLGSKKTARGNILILQLQLAIVYFFAGMAKLNADWIFEAMPLKIWLPSKSDLWLIGPFLKQEWMAYAFSWGGAIYDLLIPFLLFYKPSRSFAYLLVIVFHMLTWILFQIGMFPFIMIAVTLIFFSSDFHEKVQLKLRELLNFLLPLKEKERGSHLIQNKANWNQFKLVGLGLFLILQLLIPLRYLLYPGNVFWTEEGYRFSWRVMLMEKAGYCVFEITDPSNGKRWEVNNYDFLSPVQEKMMSTQADMILQYAHFLEEHYEREGINEPIIKVKSYVTLNGSPSRLFINPNIDLTALDDSFQHKEWILEPAEKIALQ